MPKTIFLLRHGQVEEQYQGVCRGSIDCLLSEVGMLQSQRNADYLHRRGVRRIITSGRMRTDYLGQHMLKEHHVTHSVDKGFQEMSLGEWEGKTWVEIEQTHECIWRNFKQHPAHTQIPNGEDPAVFLTRVMLAWNAMLAMQEETIAIVAHGIVNTAIVNTICRLGIDHLHQEAGCINEIAVLPKEYTPVRINYTVTHVPDQPAVSCTSSSVS